MAVLQAANEDNAAKALQAALRGNQLREEVAALEAALRADFLEREQRLSDLETAAKALQARIRGRDSRAKVDQMQKEMARKEAEKLEEREAAAEALQAALRGQNARFCALFVSVLCLLHCGSVFSHPDVSCWLCTLCEGSGVSGF